MEESSTIIYAVNVLVVDSSKKRIFSVKRGLSDKFYPGMYALPGGQIEKGESLEDAAKREFIEETGYSLVALERTKLQTEFSAHGVRVKVQVVRGVCGDKVGDSIDPEIESADWIDIQTFLESLRKNHYPELEIQKFERFLARE